MKKRYWIAGATTLVIAGKLLLRPRDADWNKCRDVVFHSGRFMYLGMESVVENRGYDVLEDAGAIGGNHESSFGVDEAATVRRALSWIDTVPRDQHFFLTYLPIAGHHPYDTPTPGPFKESSDRGRYVGLRLLRQATQW